MAVPKKKKRKKFTILRKLQKKLQKKVVVSR
jgi:hypothetical protein